MKPKQNYVVICTKRGNHSILPQVRQALCGLFVKFCLLIFTCLFASACSAQQETGRETEAATGTAVSGVQTGLDVLIAQNFAPLQGKRVGLITNQTGIARDGRNNIDILFHAAQQSKQARPGNFRLVALFSPEHGLRGRAAAGAKVSSSRDRTTGLPIYSLYGKTQKPTPAMLRNIDMLVFDIQDIGSRSYTYISTLGLCMEAAAQNHVAFMVLDRPNPSGGNRIEGNIPPPPFRSFVGKYPVPYLHGLTVGELAKLLNGEKYLSGGVQCNLTVVPMQNWQRDMTWEQTGLRWIAPSPHIPFARTALYYAATGQAGELSALSIGVGTALPFEYAGAPGMNAKAYAAELSQRNLSGVQFTPAAWTPEHGVYTGKRCAGVHIEFTDIRGVELCRLNFELMDAARKVMPNLRFFTDGEQTRMFDLVNGTDEARQAFAQGKSASQIWQQWNKAASAFRIRRRPYLLYPEN